MEFIKRFFLPEHSLRRRIMRRVWYSYSLRVVLAKETLQGFAFGFSLALFFSLVSVSSIIKNLLAIKVGTVPEYLWQALLQSISSGEFAQLIALGVIIFSLLSFRLPHKVHTVAEQELRSV